MSSFQSPTVAPATIPQQTSTNSITTTNQNRKKRSRVTLPEEQGLVLQQMLEEMQELYQRTADKLTGWTVEEVKDHALMGNWKNKAQRQPSLWDAAMSAANKELVQQGRQGIDFSFADMVIRAKELSAAHKDGEPAISASLVDQSFEELKERRRAYLPREAGREQHSRTAILHEKAVQAMAVYNDVTHKLEVLEELGVSSIVILSKRDILLSFDSVLWSTNKGMQDMLLRQINHTPESLKNGIWAIEGAAHGLLTSGTCESVLQHSNPMSQKQKKSIVMKYLKEQLAALDPAFQEFKWTNFACWCVRNRVGWNALPANYDWWALSQGHARLVILAYDAMNSGGIKFCILDRSNPMDVDFYKGQIQAAKQAADTCKNRNWLGQVAEAEARGL